MTAKILQLETKKCRDCSTQKDADQFDLREKNGINRQMRCKDCTRIYARERYRRHKDRQRFVRLKKVYGLTESQFLSLHAQQGGRCKICLKHESDMAHGLHVDHCHETGLVRGLLCFNCNRGLGSFKDDLQSLRAAIRYLGGSDAS